MILYLIHEKGFNEIYIIFLKIFFFLIRIQIEDKLTELTEYWYSEYYTNNYCASIVLLP